MSTSLTAAPGTTGNRPPPEGMPVDLPQPPTIAESGDPFSTLRVIDLIARIERGRPIRVDDLVDRLNATHLDWLFTRAVVIDALIALQANWMTDYRNASGIVLDDSTAGPTVTLEDSSRVDPWIVRQAQREAAECRRALQAFARRDTWQAADDRAAPMMADHPRQTDRRRQAGNPAGRCACPGRARSR